MHTGLNVHLLQNTKYLLSLGYDAEAADAIWTAQTTHAALQEHRATSWENCTKGVVFKRLILTWEQSVPRILRHDNNVM